MSKRQLGKCFRCGTNETPVYTYGMSMYWTCEECNKKKTVTLLGKKYRCGGTFSSCSHNPEEVEAWCKAFLRAKKKNSKPIVIGNYYTKV